jgi:divalent metal cation (Fe/Co/Zn/Cd) transporter
MATETLERERLLRHGLRLEWLTISWNLVEGFIAVTAAVSAGSVALLGFGIDSFVESASGLVLVWRLLAERGSDAERVERMERRAEQLVAASLFGLAIYIAVEACLRLIAGGRPEVSRVGIAVTSLSIGVMWWLGRAKRKAAHALGSRALHADASQTTACLWLSMVTLTGVSLNAALGWWWADPVAALGLVYFIAVEGREAWRGEECRSSHARAAPHVFPAGRRPPQR